MAPAALKHRFFGRERLSLAAGLLLLRLRRLVRLLGLLSVGAERRRHTHGEARARKNLREFHASIVTLRVNGRMSGQ